MCKVMQKDRHPFAIMSCPVGYEPTTFQNHEVCKKLGSTIQVQTPGNQSNTNNMWLPASDPYGNCDQDLFNTPGQYCCDEATYNALENPVENGVERCECVTNYCTGEGEDWFKTCLVESGYYFTTASNALCGPNVSPRNRTMCGDVFFPAKLEKEGWVSQNNEWTENKHGVATLALSGVVKNLPPCAFNTKASGAQTCAPGCSKPDPQCGCYSYCKTNNKCHGTDKTCSYS